MRCRVHGSKVVRWTTRDGAVVNPAATVQVCDARRVTGDNDSATDALAAFGKGCRVQCRCTNDSAWPPAECDALYIFDAAGEHIATMHGRWKPKTLENGNVGISRVPTGTGDGTQDKAFNLGNALRALNEKNDEFWRSRYEEE